MNVEAIASICHEANRAYCEALGDHTQHEWWSAPDWQRASAISGVQFHINNRGASDASSHNEWMRVKFADGWVWGPFKDAEKKTHPCLVPFNELPAQQQRKDALFKAVVSVFREAIAHG